jgi:hypothetical protein
MLKQPQNITNVSKTQLLFNLRLMPVDRGFGQNPTRALQYSGWMAQKNE